MPNRQFKKLLSPIGRLFLIVLLTGILVSPVSGQIFRKFGTNPFKKASTETPPAKFANLPSQQELLASLQARTNKVKQLDSRVTVKMAGIPQIKGTFQVEFPNRMRMKAGVLGASEMGVDVGSNDQDFWIWSKADLPGQPPTFLYANHAAFARSPVRQAIPLEPKWLVEAIGLIDYAPTDRHSEPVINAEGWLQLKTVHQTPMGPQYRMTLLSATTGLIEQQAIYDSQLQRIAYANSRDYKYYPEHQISLPQEIELFISQPGQDDLKISVSLTDYGINSLYGDPERMWAMPDPGKDKTIDLTQVSLNNSPPQQQPFGQPARQPTQRARPNTNDGFR